MDQIHARFSTLLASKAASPEIVHQVLDRTKFLIRETFELREVLVIQALKVLTSLKRSNTALVYRHLRFFFFRHFSFDNLSHAHSFYKLKLGILIGFVLHSIFVFSFHSDLSRIQQVRSASADENLSVVMLFCVTVAIGYILYEIIFRKYRSVVFFAASKVTPKYFFHLIFRDRKPPQLERFHEALPVASPLPRPVAGRGGMSRNFNEMELLEREKEFQRKRFIRHKAVMTNFQVVVRRVLTLLRCIRALHHRNEIATEHRHNPHIAKFFSKTFLWVFVYVLVLVAKPAADEDYRSYSLRTFRDNLWSADGRWLVFLVALYILLDNFENNRYRRNNYSSILNTNFKSFWARVLFQVEGLVPLYLELKTVLTFISSKTSLGLDKWFQIENIKRILLTAKFINEGEKRKVVGYPESRTKKWAVGGTFLAVLFALVVTPFWAFSNMNPLVHLPVITRANLFLEIAFADNSYSRMNKFTLVELNSESISQATGADIPARHLPKSEQDQVTKVRFEASANRIYDYNPTFFERFRGQFFDVLFRVQLITAMHTFESVEVITSFRDDKTGMVEFLSDVRDQKGRASDDFLEDTFFGKFSNFLETTIHGKLVTSRRVTSKQKLLVKSSYIYHKRYFSLSLGDPLEIFVLRKPLGANFKLGRLQESWSTFSRMYLFIFFVVGITFLGKKLMNKTNIIWNENIPRTNNILKLIDNVQLARYDFNFEMEQFYYLCLVDTFRSTQEILAKTGTMKAFIDKIYKKQKANRRM